MPKQSNPKQISTLISILVRGSFRPAQPNTDFDTAAACMLGYFQVHAAKKIFL